MPAHSSPLSAQQILARLRFVDGVGSGLESDVVMAARPVRSGGSGSSLSTIHAGIVAPALNPDATRARAIFGA